jgi:C1A family cysteine protease
MYKNYKLTHKFQSKDERDHIFNASLIENTECEYYTITKPTKNEIINNFTKKSKINYKISPLANILDQGSYGSCVSNAFAYTISTQTKKTLLISRMYLYDFSRIQDYTSLDQDSGTTIRGACSAVKKYGSVPEALYKYTYSNFCNLPSLSTIQNSKLFKKFEYTFINQDITSIKNYINTHNSPIIFGFMVYSSFFDVNNTGIVALPNTSTETLEGGHCMCIIGYDDTKYNGVFVCANSWGTSWGDKGYCYIPYSYLLNSDLAGDFCGTKFIY